MSEDTAASARTLMDLLVGQADRLRDKVAFSFCPDGADEQARLTYRELDSRARAIASWLQEQGATGQRVLVICRPGLAGVAAIFGCFYAGAVAVPIDDHWVSARLAAVVPDAGAGFALATAKSREKWQQTVDGLVDGSPPRWLTLDDDGAAMSGAAENWMMPRLEPDDTAMLQYTSGSTGPPKGVMLTHGNLLHNLSAGPRAWNPQPDHHIYQSPVTGVSWLPHYQQMGLVGVVLGSLYVGGTSVLMSPGSFLMRPMRWLEAMSRHRAVITVAPKVAYDWCVKRSTPEQRAELDLTNWSVAAVGGEPVREETLRAFVDAFAPAGFRPEAFLPVYGLAEATLGVSGVSASSAPMVDYLDRAALGDNRIVDLAPGDAGAAAVVGCGRVIAGCEVRIVDPDTVRERAADEVGEIWVAGPSVTPGYWRRATETTRKFRARLDTGAGPYLRTGDLGYLRGGELFVTGRATDLIVVDGSIHYPNDIETTVQDAHPALLPGRGAAFGVVTEPSGSQRVVVVQEIQRHRAEPVDTADMLATIRAAISKHHRIEVQAVLLVKPMHIPTTPTGKVQRGRCRQQFLDDELDPVAEWRAPTPPAAAGPRDPAKQLAAGLAGLVATALARRRPESSGPDRR